MTTSKDYLIEGFCQSLLIEKHASSATRETYRHEVACFFDYLSDNGLQCDSITSTQIKDFLTARASNLSSRTVSKVITALRMFFLYLQEEKIRSDDPMELIPVNKVKKNLPVSLDNEEVDRILSVIDTSDAVGLRDRTLFELIYSCGLRASEASDLKVGDYYNQEGHLKVRGKGDKERLVPVGDEAASYIQQYLSSARGELLNGRKSPFLFVGVGSTHLSREEIWTRLQKYCNLCGIKSKVHTLRHSYATELLKNGADIRSVQELLGHSDIRTTEIYTHVNTSQLLEAFEAFHPDGDFSKRK